MPFVIDESSFRIDTTQYPSLEEATQKAGESAKILGRRVNVYELVDGVEQLVGHALPDGTLDTQNLTVLTDPDRGAEVPLVAPVAKGSVSIREIVAALDEVSEELEKRGDSELVSEIDSISLQLLVNDDSSDDSMDLEGELLDNDDSSDDSE